MHVTTTTEADELLREGVDLLHRSVGLNNEMMEELKTNRIHLSALHDVRREWEVVGTQLALVFAALDAAESGYVLQLTNGAIVDIRALRAVFQDVWE